MAITLAANFVSVTNQILPLNINTNPPGLSIRVASQASNILGTLTASNAVTTELTWELVNAPSWITFSIDTTTTICTLTFSNAQPQINPYQFYVSVTDGLTTTFYPIFLEVRDPFSIQATTGQTNFSIPSYDSTQSDLIFKAYGLNGVVDSGASFILPPVVPGGLEFTTSDGSEMLLRIPLPNSTNPSGGITLYTTSPISSHVQVSGYKEGTFYDSPARPFIQDFTIDSLTAKIATVDVTLSAFFNSSNGNIEVDSYVDFLQGIPVAFTYLWVISGSASGIIQSGGGTSDHSVQWLPTSTGTVIVTLSLINSSTSQVITSIATLPIQVATGSTWVGTPAIRVYASASEYRNNSNQSVTIPVSAEVAAGETVTINLTTTPGSSIEGTLTLNISTLTLTNSGGSTAIITQSFNATIPLAATYNQKWAVKAAAVNGGSTRTGFAEFTVLSNGPAPITVTVSQNSIVTSTITSIVGSSMNPVTILLSSTPIPVYYFLVGAPDGLFISSNQIVGNVLQPGTYIFKVVIQYAGTLRSYSSNITLNAAAGTTPLTISNPSSSSQALPDNTQFTVNWGYSGSPTTLLLAQNFTTRSVLGAISASTTQVGSSVLTVYGTSFYGDAYSAPIIVLSSSVTSSGALLDSPTIGTIDQNDNLVLNWNPLLVEGSYQVYKAWNIWLTLLPNGTKTLQTINGKLPTGLEPNGATPDARIFDSKLNPGDWQITMQALTNNTQVALNSNGWDNPHNFPSDPSEISGSLVTLDNSTIDLGQTLTITLNPNYIGADNWQIVFADGSSTGWMPISNRVVTKVFNIPGNLSIVVLTQRDYSSAIPSVKLRRQYTTNVYVMNQQFVTASNNTLTGNLGLGGTSGFELTNATNNAVPLENYEVIVRAIVRDTINNELKLMVATSRTTNASSVLGTMAIDVFPIEGRPHSIELVKLPVYLSPENYTVVNPVVIATSALPTVIVGKPMADFLLQVVANTGIGPFSWYADNLPFGLNLSSNGTLNGTATTIESIQVNISVVDSNQPPYIASQTFTLNVESDLLINNQVLPNGVVTVPYNTPVQFSGGIPPYNWSIVAGSAPIGVTIDPVAGTLIGTPCTYNSNVDFNTVYKFTVQVIDSIGAIASRALSMSLQAAPLSLGPADQSNIYVNETFEVTVPIYGGTPPYSLVKINDDGVIGTGLSIINPQIVAVVAGIEPPSLTITTPTTQPFFPQTYPFDPGILLTATGGLAPYTWTVIPGLNTNLPLAAISNSLVTCAITTNGTYTVKIGCTDSLGSFTTVILTVTTQQKNIGTYTIKPVLVNTNGAGGNPANFIITNPMTSPVTNGLPDASQNNPYNNGSSGVFWGLALYADNVLNITQTIGASGPINFTVRSGSLPYGIIGFSANSYGEPTDYSGLILFNSVGGFNPPTLGEYSFEAEFSNIFTGSAVTQTVARYSITVTPSGSGITSPYTSSPVVVVTTGSPVALVADGSIDPHYTLTVSPDTNFPGPNAYAQEALSIWYPNLPEAKWLTPYPNQYIVPGSPNPYSLPNGAEQSAQPGVYRYQTTFNLTGTVPSTASLTGVFASDDTGILYLNGLQVASSVAGTSTPFVVTNGFINGTNTLIVQITNNGGSPNPTGFLLDVSGIVQSLGGAIQAINVYGTGIATQSNPPIYVVDLAKANLTPYPWYYPLNAEGGDISVTNVTIPYTFNINNNTLPGAAVVLLNGMPALTSTATNPSLGSYQVFLTAIDPSQNISIPSELSITLTKSTTKPVNIVSYNFPAYIYTNRPLPSSTYYVESDIPSNWSASNLPPGVTLSVASGTKVYLTGTPTTSGNFTIAFTATSVVYGTSTTYNVTILIKPQTAVFLNPPTSAVIGINYRVVTNNAIIKVQYTGYQPSDAGLPLVTSQTGTVGAPGVINNGANTTGVSNLSPDGFVMSFDYVNNTPGNDVITLATTPAQHDTIVVSYPTLLATGITSTVSVSEYSNNATVAAPVQVTGGDPPYNLTLTGFSDSRFIADGSQVNIDIPALEVGQTTSCSVAITVTDAISNTTTATGIIAVTVNAANFIDVIFSNIPWTFSTSTVGVYTIAPNILGSIPILGHTPFQYYVDNVTLPIGLTGNVTISPSHRLLVVNIGSSSATLNDLDQSLNPSSSFSVPAIAINTLSPGNFTIPVVLRVVDNNSISTSQTVNINLTVAS